MTTVLSASGRFPFSTRPLTSKGNTNKISRDLLPLIACLIILLCLAHIIFLPRGMASADLEDNMIVARLGRVGGIGVSDGSIGGDVMSNPESRESSASPTGDHNVAIATAVMAAERLGVSYAAMACALGLQLRELYPSVERLVIVGGRIAEAPGALGGAGGLRRRLRRCGFTRVVPIQANATISASGCVGSGWVYVDQSMKFGLWNLTEYGRVVFFDSDTFFYYDDADAMRHSLNPLFNTAGTEKDELRGCPTPWSNITMNGGLFSLEPSRLVSSRLFHYEKTSFFASELGHKYAVFDCTEMGPLNEVYKGRWKMVDKGNVCISTDTKRLRISDLDHPFVYHGLKPTHSRQTYERWRNFQREAVFKKRGYDEEALAVLDVVFNRLVLILREAGTLLLANESVVSQYHTINT